MGINAQLKEIDMRSSVWRGPAGGREERSELTEVCLERLLTVTHTFQKFPKITYNLMSNYYQKKLCHFFFDGANYGSQLRKNSLGINSTRFILQPMTESSENYIWFSPFNKKLGHKNASTLQKEHSRKPFLSMCYQQ